jgi:tRNA A-37 threonylcarbamoyl transferase component Bud32
MSVATSKTDETQVLNHGGWANGDVYLTRAEGLPAVIKTYADKPVVIRLLGRFLLGRERKAYETLRGLEGVPALLPSQNPYSLAIEYVPGARISDEMLARDGVKIIGRLAHVIDSMHQRGVYHMDLRNQGNILIGENHDATVLDFASAVFIHGANPISRLIAALCRRFDLYGLSKWRSRSKPLGER